MEMDVETAQMAAACLGIGTVILCRRQKKNVDSEKSGLSRGFRPRETDGAFHRLLKDLEGDPDHYSNYLRLDFATFEGHVQSVYPFLKKRNTKMRNVRHVCDKLSSGVHQSRFLLFSN